MDYKREADKFGFIWIISAIILSILEPIYIGYESVFDNNGYNSGNHFGALRGFMLCARFRAWNKRRSRPRLKQSDILQNVDAFERK